MIETIFIVLGNLAMVFSAAFVAIQIKQLKRDYNLKYDKAENERAVELSKYYSEDILLTKVTYITLIFNNCGIEKLINSLKYAQLKEFDKQELEEILGQPEISKIMTLFNSVDLDILINARRYLSNINLDEHLDALEAIKTESYIKSNSPFNQVAAGSANGVNAKKLNDDVLNKYNYYQNKYRTEFVTEVAKVLNQLEYFCMNFNSGIANEKIIYQSLHQTFLSTIKLLYFKISIINITGKDKYYTNIISLYNEWSNRYYDQKKIEDESNRCGTYKVTKPKR